MQDGCKYSEWDRLEQLSCAIGVVKPLVYPCRRRHNNRLEDRD